MIAPNFSFQLHVCNGMIKHWCAFLCFFFLVIRPVCRHRWSGFTIFSVICFVDKFYQVLMFPTAFLIKLCWLMSFTAYHKLSFLVFSSCRWSLLLLRKDKKKTLTLRGFSIVGVEMKSLSAKRSICSKRRVGLAINCVRANIRRWEVHRRKWKGREGGGGVEGGGGGDKK